MWQHSLAPRSCCGATATASRSEIATSRRAHYLQVCFNSLVGHEGFGRRWVRRRKTLQHTATHCNALQHTATHCNILQDTATHCDTLQHTATHCNTLQHTATYRNTLQHTATHCYTLQHTATHCYTLLHTATHCYTLLHTATHCNTLQHTLHMKDWGEDVKDGASTCAKCTYSTSTLLSEHMFRTYVP